MKAARYACQPAHLATLDVLMAREPLASHRPEYLEMLDYGLRLIGYRFLSLRPCE